MKKLKETKLEFIVDKLTNSIENIQSGDSFQTEVSLLASTELKNIIKKNGWNFDWKTEFKQAQKDVYKLTIVNNPNIIQGLVSLEVKSDHVYMHLIESAPFNIGINKVYLGVPGNLIAFACKLSFQRGGEGYVSFIAKTKLIDHYIKTLGAVHFGGHLMVITTETALKLIGKYYKS
ncbi:MAG TPA: hypothetical protein PLJ42_02125 [Chitinophagales bacterium]|jgi:hypothetical protein|nr:hypothetical protein [Chitinophagales bacterium]MBP6154492.1 hypothetical protein [Chitinophagales bacterium]HQV77729.1 hypothetical protein [Chitinophagales bacterium]HQW78202.1 hypothetical protein [Chitinophagales bacterium]HRB66895.1 hypothetical protein [Chitinophagales bacterium]